MNSTERREKLGAFLRQCRERLQPADVGLPPTPRRRTPGLRREEVAVLAGISLTYYTKIEQGRLDVTLPVLEALSAALQLNRPEKQYAFTLATGQSATTPESQQEVVGEVLQRILQSQGDNPAYIMGRRWDILAWNEAAAAMLGDFATMSPLDRNTVVQMFTKPINRELIVDWEKHAKVILAEFRANYGQYHDDPAFGELIHYLQAHSEAFRDWWENYYQVGGQVELHKQVNHPLVGRLRLWQTSFYVDDSPNLRLVIYLPGDEVTAQKLQQLCAMRRGLTRPSTMLADNGHQQGAVAGVGLAMEQ